MKVVLFCGGQGMRIRDYSDRIPKPMVPIGYQPILWHVMKYYAHYGHKDFILCLGYKADVIKSYFLNYNECLSNDFVISEGGKKVDLLSTDIHDWRITFVDTGINANIGERLRAVVPHLKGEEMFLANYSDGLTDCPLPDFVDFFKKSGKVASFLCPRPTHSFHVIAMQEDYRISSIEDLNRSNIRINGGYFVFRREIFDHLRPGEELVHEPFHRLIDQGQLIGYPYDGFWMAMDTFKQKQELDEMYSRGEAPWEVWKAREPA